jgi:hypothetical protein
VDLRHERQIENAELEVAAATPLQTLILTKPDRPLYCRRRPCWNWPGGDRRLGDTNQETTHAQIPSPNCSPRARSTLSFILHHPLYAGAFIYGCDRLRRGSRSTRPVSDPAGRPGDGGVLIWDRCPAYITRERFERNQRQLADNQARQDSRGVPRGGAWDRSRIRQRFRSFGGQRSGFLFPARR